MRAAILSIGTELTRGELVNSNATWLSERLTALGFEVMEHAVVPDDSAWIGGTLSRFGRQVKLVVSTGGLGPTSDDMTAAAVAELLGVPLRRDEPSLARIRDRYARQGREMPAPNVKQADLPEGAAVLDNDEGTAPGFAVDVGEARCFFLPGVPREMRHMFEVHVATEMGPRVARTSHQVHIRSFGLRESEVAERLTELDLGGARQREGVTLGYRARFPEIEIKVLARGADEAGASALAAEVAREVRDRLRPHDFGDGREDFPEHVHRLLQRSGLKLAVAESCTGGLIGKLLTDHAGSSDYLLLDAVTYANAAKHAVLGVGEAVLERHGAVSSEVAAAMADGARAAVDADLAVATTGIAGPGGGTADKPVGTVWLGLARRGEKTLTERIQLSGDRGRIRTLTAHVALLWIARAAAASLDPQSAQNVQDRLWS
ncbi:MAG: competence/damage-inducible protein A [Myxococcales bacterium]|jgi:nicotinamide-nucleotide amidase